MLSIPALQAILGLTGAIVGNAIFGAGLMGLGRALATRSHEGGPSQPPILVHP